MRKSYASYLNPEKKYSEMAPNIMLASFVVWVCVFGCMLFPLFGFILSFFVSCFLCIGFKNIVLQSLRNKNIEVENVFSYYKNCISAFCLGICSIVLIAIWSVAFVIPGIVAGLNYTFAPYIFAENPKIGTIKCLEKSKELTQGHRGELFILYLIQVLFITLSVVFLCSLMVILNFIVSVPLWIHILVPIIGTLFLYFVVIYPYFQIFVGNLYLSLFPVTKQKKLTSPNKSVTKVVD